MACDRAGHSFKSFLSMKQLAFFLFFVLFLNLGFSSVSSASGDTSVGKILFSLPDREVTLDEFRSYIEKNDIGISNRNFDSVLEGFIDYHLKIACGRAERLDRTVEYINEVTDYRTTLAAPYLTHSEKTGYYIQQAYERLRFSLNVDHVLIRADFEEVPSSDTMQHYQRAMAVRSEILTVATNDRTRMVDQATPGSWEKLGDITAFQTEYSFENAVYNLSEGEISLPVRTGLGYHIVRVNHKRITPGLPPLEDMKDQILEAIRRANDRRIRIIEDAFTEELKAYWNFSSHQEALDRYRDQLSITGIISPDLFPVPENKNDTLCLIDEKVLTTLDFWKYILHEGNEEDTPVPDQTLEARIDRYFRKFIQHRLYLYENYMLEKKYPAFRDQMTNFRDATLLLAVIRKHVWSGSGIMTEGPGQDAMELWVEELRQTIPVEIHEKTVQQVRKEFLSLND